jgi:type IV secretion system protein VirB1
MRALIVHESGGFANAIDDDTTHRSFRPATRSNAIRIARELLREGHTIDVGYAQIDSDNFAAFGLDVDSAFDPCTNIRTAAEILTADYERAMRTYGPGQTALAHALSAYNSGNEWAGSTYAAAVFATAATLSERQ